MTLEDYVHDNRKSGFPIICDSYDQTVELTNRLLAAGAHHGGSGYSKRIANGSSKEDDTHWRHVFLSCGGIEYYSQLSSVANDEDAQKFYYSDFDESNEEELDMDDSDSIPDSFLYLKGAFAL